MNGNGYLIPANSKKSEMLLGMFTYFDLGLFIAGVLVTVGLLLGLHPTKLGDMILALLPALTAAFLVFPIPNYHNILQLIVNIYTFFFVKQRRYNWKGWCYKNGSNK